MQTENNAFLTIKDHKPKFPSKVECRLITPAKSNIGKISKSILKDAINDIKLKSKYNLWTDSIQVTKWFNNLPNKTNMKFFKFDIVSFYPSITSELLEKARLWAETYYKVDESQLKIILHARESYLFNENDIWVKKNNPKFDVSMGAYDGAELCEFIGLYIISNLEMIFGKENIGLYRDDGLAVINASGPDIERIRKDVFKLFKNMNLKVTLESHTSQTEFLDLFLDLKTESYRPYRKKNEIPVYIDKQSNHPNTIKKQLPNMINNRISNLSSSKQIFQNESKAYEDALKSAGYQTNMKYMTPSNKPKTRKRKILWYNPPFSQNVQTNVAGKFLSLITKHFESSELKKYFNRKTVKVSYSCMPNMETIIKSHNRSITSWQQKQQDENKTCNCRIKANCPLNGKCQIESIIYKANVNSGTNIVSYIGQTSNSFKERYRNHTSSFNNQKYANSTHLSKFIWNLKSKNKPYNIEWSILNQTPSYNPNTESCSLCQTEKIHILKSKLGETLNHRSELVSRCIHSQKFRLSNT